MIEAITRNKESNATVFLRPGNSFNSRALIGAKSTATTIAQTMAAKNGSISQAKAIDIIANSSSKNPYSIRPMGGFLALT
jgi:hypothetical protein